MGRRKERPHKPVRYIGPASDYPLATLRGVYMTEPQAHHRSCHRCDHLDACHALEADRQPVRCEWPLTIELSDPATYYESRTSPPEPDTETITLAVLRAWALA